MLPHLPRYFITHNKKIKYIIITLIYYINVVFLVANVAVWYIYEEKFGEMNNYL